MKLSKLRCHTSFAISTERDCTYKTVPTCRQMGSEQIGHDVCLLLLWLWFLFIVKKMKGTQGSRVQGGDSPLVALQRLGYRHLTEAISGGMRASQALAPHWPGSNLCSTTYWLCDLRQVMPPLWASVSLSAKMGFIIMLTTRHIGRTPKDTGYKAPSKAGYHHWISFITEVHSICSCP